LAIVEPGEVVGMLIEEGLNLAAAELPWEPVNARELGG
jgi:hypothetical protein